jgi:hypothetical protein
VRSDVLTVENPARFCILNRTLIENELSGGVIAMPFAKLTYGRGVWPLVPIKKNKRRPVMKVVWVRLMILVLIFDQKYGHEPGYVSSNEQLAAGIE